MVNPLVSVLIPLYNAERYLVECLESVVGQTYPSLEVIIVNDGSTDNSLPIANEYADRYEWIRVYSQKNSGAASARNKAFSLSTGEYIQYFDSDDIMHPGKISFQMEALRQYDYDPYISVIGQWARFYGTIDNAVFDELKTYKNYDNTLIYLMECWENFQCMIGTAWLIHRKLHEEIGGWDPLLSVHDDYLFFAKVAYFSNKIIYAHQSIVYWRQDNLQSLSNVRTWKGLRSHMEVCNQLFELVQKESNIPRLKHSLAMEYSKLIYRAYPLYPDLVNKAEKMLKILGFDNPLPMPTKKFRLFVKIIGFYPTARLFGFKDKLVKKIRVIKDSRRWR